MKPSYSLPAQPMRLICFRKGWLAVLVFLLSLHFAVSTQGNSRIYCEKGSHAFAARQMGSAYGGQTRIVVAPLRMEAERRMIPSVYTWVGVSLAFSDAGLIYSPGRVPLIGVGCLRGGTIWGGGSLQRYIRLGNLDQDVGEGAMNWNRNLSGREIGRRFSYGIPAGERWPYQGRVYQLRPVSWGR